MSTPIISINCVFSHASNILMTFKAQPLNKSDLWIRGKVNVLILSAIQRFHCSGKIYVTQKKLWLGKINPEHFVTKFLVYVLYIYEHNYLSIKVFCVVFNAFKQVSLLHLAMIMSLHFTMYSMHTCISCVVWPFILIHQCGIHIQKNSLKEVHVP